MLQIVTSTSASARLGAVRAFLSKFPPATECAVVGASRGAADDCVRALAINAAATFGLTRFSFTELAVRAASVSGTTRRAPGSAAGAEAIAARAVHDARQAGELEYFEPVAATPGFPKALARTIHELRLAVITPASLTADLSRLLARFEEALSHAAVDDRAALFDVAAAGCRAGRVRWAQMPLVLLDVALDSRAEQAFAAALIASNPAVLSTVPDGDHASLEALVSLGGRVTVAEDDAEADSDLARLRRFVFSTQQPDARVRAGDVTMFSAPGEGRETVEIVRRMLDESGRGVRFDEMAVILRSPQHYVGLLEHACARGGVPAYFDRGTRRPDPSGRAFLALISCAVDGLSAKRFDEYLSLGQVPQVSDDRGYDVVIPDDEALRSTSNIQPTDTAPAIDASAAADSDDEAVIAGTLRSPWKWEELIVESAVVGGRTRADGKARWRRRLDGLRADFEYRRRELLRDEPDSPRVSGIDRDLRNLTHLRQFALPIIDHLADWPDEGTWGEWLDRLTALAQRSLRRPGRVLKTLADLRPMAAVGPVGLDAVRDVLHDRLATLDWEPPARRYGCVFVGTPLQARGRSFRVIFVPGLAERMVPQRPHEDPLLLDAARQRLDPALMTLEQRGAAERLLLKIAIGAASERLYLSYPRLDVSETRARVPSFYALDVMRAITGQVPDHRRLGEDAALEGGESLAWPAPKDPARAIDELEHDLAMLKPLLDNPDRAAVKGHAHYLLGLNEALRRSVTVRWQRDKKSWSPGDGLTRVAPATRSALARNRLGVRAYSLSALQRFSTCPYQFLLATIYRLRPWDEPEPLLRMDPLTRGSLFHETQAAFYRAMEQRDALPIRAVDVPAAAQVLDQVLDAVAGEYAEKLAPAIDRVWRDEIDEIRRDLGIWLQKIAGDEVWLPAYFEFSFGLSDAGRDPRSLPDPIRIDDRFILRGSVDLIEHRADTDALRVTDHKTGKNRSTPDLIVGGGGVLQPVLYSVAIATGLRKPVSEGRLFYATTAGGFVVHPIPITDYTRSQGLQVLEIIDRAIETGFLAPAPAERACTWCDFRPVCGPHQEERIGRKAPDRLADLQALRSMR